MTHEPGLKFHAKPRKHRASPEAELQKCVCQHLKINGAPGILFLKITNEGKRSPRLGHEMKMQGLRTGAADLLICRDGQAFFLELKKKGEKPRKSQIAFAADCLIAGCDYAVADGIDDALKLLTAWGLLGRRMARAP